jgi:hypothetical protein
MSDALPTSVLKSVIWGDDMGLNEVTDLDEQADPMTGFILHNQVQAAIGKSSDVAIVLDMALPEGDVDSDEPVYYKTPRIIHGVSGALRRTSDAAFVRVLAKVRSVFDGHPEEMDAAVELVTKIRQEARARAIAAATS